MLRAALVVRVKSTSDFKFTAKNITQYLANVFFEKKYLCVVDNCNWTGNECDMLVVTENLRIIDVEIKISRADLKADAGKTKWKDFSVRYQNPPVDPTYVEHPRKIWKHYYCLPKNIWKDELYECLPSDCSGVILLTYDDIRKKMRHEVVRRSKPNTKADKISYESVINIARLASLRMWNSRNYLDK